ncbi:T9SS type A sorting domain-containing protein [Hymenobacter setariae]|uniref:T9SS type A sorting domain-containing protein n=1 Tax=Hymenobacter setariae TaxID=2594794 RepID=A0A558BPI0_9BACT|nr:T9SS type A sorting domain-containing protein [Hymenobacter setariae]TVT38430.1 T9SS type A sorting domain-containing protein [Hymenobacter setariae]
MDLLRLIRHTGLGLVLLAAVVGAVAPLHAQTPPSFDRVEYYFDTDPGLGQGTAVALPATPATTLTNLPFTVSLAPLSAGFHTLFVRSRAGTNKWSQTYRQILYKEPVTSTTPVPALAGAEYFVDADPGYGAGKAVAMAGGGTNAAGVAFTVSLTGVAPGFHALSVRSKDAQGRWSQTYRQIFYVEPPTTTAPPANLAAIEYFVDTDPGYGKGSSAPITGGSTNATGASFTVGLGTLPIGFHTLFYRVKDAAGKWSQTQDRLFYVDDPSVANVPTLNKAEYFFDTDPGYGLGVNVPIATPSTNLTNLNLLADASALAEGQHRLFVRVRDANGRWSQVLSRPFAKRGCSNSPNYAANQPAASYTGNGISQAASEQLFNGSAVTANSASFFSNYYTQVDLGATLRTISEVQLSLRNPNGTAVNYVLTVEASGNLSTWSAIDTYSATLPANQATPTSIVRTLATPQANVRGLRLRLTLPSLAQGIQVTSAGAYFFTSTCPVPVVTNFTPAGGPGGTVVTITGTNLDGATAVTFNGTPAGPITNNTSTSLTVAAPAGGTDGQICVTTTGGTACSGASYLYPAAIATGTVSPATFCAGTSISVPFSTNTARFSAGNAYNFQLSDANGVFAANAPLLGTAANITASGGTVTGTIPLNTPAGTGYQVRVVASSPSVTGAPNSADLSINTAPVSQATGPTTVANGAPIALAVSPTYPGATYAWYSSRTGYLSAQQNLTTSTTTPGVTRYTVNVTLGSCTYSSYVDVAVQTSTDPILALNTFSGPLCLGSSRTLVFTVTGNSFPSGNVLTAQLSDANGSFATPISLGTQAYSGLTAGSGFSVTIPAGTAPGSGYRIRLVSSTPALVSNDNGSNLTLNAPPTVTATSNSPVAQSGTIVLNGGPAVAGNSYVWVAAYTNGGSSVVGTTQNLTLTNAQPNQSGTYTLTITNAAGCTATASTNVAVTPAAPVTTIALGALSGPLCVGQGYTLSYTAAGPSFGAGNTLTAQLSDANGSFASPTSIGAVSTTAAAGTLGISIPTSAASGAGYRIRLVSSSPVAVSNDNGSSLTITNLGAASAGSNSPVAVGSPLTLTATGISGATYTWTGPNGYAATGPNQTIGSATTANAGTYSVTIALNGCSTTVSVLVEVNAAPVAASIQTGTVAGGYCAGTALNVTFTANGFAAGNVFTVQLSAAGGSFANPVSLGTLSGTSAGTIAAVIPAGTAPGTGYRIRVVGSQPATVGTDNGVNIIIGAANIYTWTGAVSTNWNTAANWSCGTVPSATSDVVIPAGLGTYPLTSLGSTAHDLTIASGASLTLGAQFVLTGNLTANGTLAPGSSALVCGGSAAQTLGGTSALRLYDLTINNTAGVTLTSPLGVRHVLTLPAGNLASGGNLTLLSDASGTAMVVNPAGGGVVTGRATMERFITGATTTGYRHYSSPMQTGTATVQEFADDVPDFNVNPDFNTQGNGVWPYPTLFQYNEKRLTTAAPTFDQGWMVPAATDNLTPGRGYSAQTTPSTVVDISGTLASTDVSYSLTRGPLAEAGWNLLGNPFPSPLDWDLVPMTDDIDRALYVYVPSGPYTGTYRSYVNGVGQNGGSKDIAAMQGFFIRATSAMATLKLPAAARSQGYSNPIFGRTAAVAVATRPLVRLRVQSAAGLADEAVVYAEPAATAAFDPAHDAYKVQLNVNGVPSLWSAAGTDKLAINALPSLAAVPSLPLGVRVSHSGAHTLQAAELLNLPAGMQVWLEDRELGTRHNLSLTPTYSFSMSVSYTGQRFYLWFETNGVLSLAPGALQAATHLYPNPATSSTTLEISGLSGAGSVQVELINTLGQVVLKRSAQPRAGILREQFDLTGLAAGMYSVLVFTPQGTVVKRLTRE